MTFNIFIVLRDFTNNQVRIEIGCGSLDSVDVPHENGVLELDVGAIFILELLRIKSPARKKKTRENVQTCFPFIYYLMLARTLL